MLRHASDLGANAVIGVRYDATELMQSVTSPGLRHAVVVRTHQQINAQ